jgi:large subunit ribosomal protein L19e
MNIRAQKRMAAKILKCGENRVYFNPEAIDDVEMSITREDIRNLIKNNIVRKRYKKGTSRIRANLRHLQKLKGRHRGFGSRKGPRGARSPAKRNWINRIRPLRRELRKLRFQNKIEIPIYRKLYLKAKGGAFNSVNTLLRYIEDNKLFRSV